MKVVLALCFLAATANAFSLDALKNMLEKELEKKEESKVVTLREYLDGLEVPHPLYRSLSARGMYARSADCGSVCGTEPTLDQMEGVTCASEKWVPEYEKSGECECLKRYRCCSSGCNTPNKETCWNNNKKGTWYGIVEVDCCGCDVVKCLECDNVLSKEDTCPKAKNIDCYDYKPTNEMAPDSACFIAGCAEKKSDAPQDESCDGACQAAVPQKSPCLFDYRTCEPVKNINTCLKNEKAANAPGLGLTCYDDPIKVDDIDNGKYWDGSTCTQCQKWSYTKKSCNDKNAMTAAYDCHQHGADKYDKKCMKKDITQDACLCHDYVCEKNSDADEAEAKFLDDEVCPKDHVKMAGTSICGSARDICKPCPTLIAMNLVPCNFGTVVLSSDCNGCPVHECQNPTIAGSPPCKSGIFTFDSEDNQFVCKVTDPCYRQEPGDVVLDPNDCAMFFECREALNDKHYSCHAGLRFNPDKRACQSREENPSLLRAACPTWE